MRIAGFAAHHARAIIFGVAFTTLAGIYALSVLPSGIYPEAEFPRIAVIAHSGDLSPQMMTVAVTRPLEESAREVLGVRRVRSKTIRGATEISVLFNADADMQQALQLMQGRIDEARPSLPDRTDIVVERMTPTVFPILSYNLTGRMPAVDLADIAHFDLRPLLARIPGVGRVDVSASDEREVSVIVDPVKLNALKLTLDEIQSALKASNQVASVGRLPRDHRQFLVLSTSELATLDDVKRVVVTFRGQTPVYVGDVADVREGTLDRTTLISGSGQPAAVINVSRQIGGNLVEIAGNVEQTLREAAHSLPPALRIAKVYDLATFVRDSVRSVRDAIIIGSVLAVLVLLVFLRDWRATLVAAIALPLTILGTFGILQLAGGTINLMSMGGLAIAIGLVIDDAIVIVENIHRHLDGSASPLVAAQRGTDELVAAVIGSTLTTVVVFIPLSLLQGVVGQFFSALSLTLSAAVLLSLVYALLFIPLPAARFLKPRPGHRHEGAGWLADRYERWLGRAVRHPWLVIAGTVVVAAVGTLLFFRLETGFLPEMDEGGYVIDYVTPAGTSLAETDAMLKRVETILQGDPDVDGFTRRTGTELGLFATEQNSGDFVVRLKPAGERARDAEAIISEQRARFAREVPGVEIEFVQLLSDMLGDLEGNPEPVEVKLFGDDLPTLLKLAEGVTARLRTVDGLVDLVGPRLGNPELQVHIDPTRAAKAGFTPEQITTQLAAGMLGAVATEVRRGDRLIDLRVRYPDSYRFDPAWVENFPLTTDAGAVVPLQATADVQAIEGSAQLYREDLKQMLPITGRLEDRDLGSAIAEVKAVLDAERLPVGYTYQIGGQYESQQSSFRSLLTVAALALLLVFGLLVAQFRQFSSALVIVSAAPLSLVGAFGLLLVTHTPLNVSSFMGLILLTGLIVKNGIILVDHAHVLSDRGAGWHDALVRAGGVRLRPILMTTLCTLFGLLPLALGLGPGAEMQRPLAIAVIGGLSVSTLVTLVFVPVVLSIMGPRTRSREPQS
ncbi:MAG TPA: efflux RND transporter permease subunit [Vicinamibacterales bacterium]|nr:efflux RND transporter permease subunit [Vicinamibacterales bacterium]